MEQCHKYLYGNHFVMYRDNNPLRYVLISAKLGATSYHWVARLANDNPALNYQSAKINVDGDALSHILKEEYDQHMEADLLCVLISQVVQGTTLMEAYFCNI